MDSGHGRGSRAGGPRETTIGQEIHALAARLFPICRSLTGKGVRQTLAIIRERLPLDLHRIRSGDQIFDWQVPREWLIRDAYIEDDAGRRIVDFNHSNLHVVNFSVPVRARMRLAALRAHIHTLPDQPDCIPYRTCYHTADWGFCMAHNAFLKMQDDHYQVVIDAEHREGWLDYGEFIHKGSSEDVFLISTHLCHPSLANDNCSGIALLSFLGAALRSRQTRFTYRLLFGPATFGALAWLRQNEAQLTRVKHGLVLSCVGDGGGPNYKRSRRGNAEIDQIMAYLLPRADLPDAKLHDFWPYGYDERQFCSPGFNLPVGSFQRSLYGSFPEYHTSKDNLDFIKADNLEQSYHLVMQAIDLAERNWTPVNMAPKGEPQLGRRGLYDHEDGKQAQADYAMALLWVLNLSDGTQTLLDMAARSQIDFETLDYAAQRLRAVGLLDTASIRDAASSCLSLT
ncbi:MULTISPECIES: DUF4910 domain-containing protein [Ochrobactrum]|uniref:DUF4910 domain-containing protein n=1 Tax=Ochrobactrum quorumnocens TaxID=271865 RepID=A0A5N1JTU8_9HYPH|nr:MULTISPECIES: DUF4910 domain-containing protein [Brucella/Ochrobactrum group]KAA9367346.1 DUF4910 domain-containing protein [[Ochrobactrum] quorumnocens]MDH7793420.1 aminopeptidase-like protein [Ochrobactrum sp. AN78]